MVRGRIVGPDHRHPCQLTEVLDLGFNFQQVSTQPRVGVGHRAAALLESSHETPDWFFSTTTGLRKSNFISHTLRLLEFFAVYDYRVKLTADLMVI